MKFILEYVLKDIGFVMGDRGVYYWKNKFVFVFYFFY